MKKIAFPFIAAAAWLIISFILLTIPGSAIPKENWLDKVWADKWVHIALFGLLTFLWCRAFHSAGVTKSKLTRIFITAAVVCIIYGIGMEFVQKYCVSNRSFDGGDIIADSIGSLLGYLYSLRRYIKK